MARPCPLPLWPTFALLMVVVAGPVWADASRRADLAQLSGSERLAVFANAKALDAGDLSPARVTGLQAGLAKLGFGDGAQAGRVLARSASLTPDLGYDSNLNGGYPGSVFDVGGIVLTADPAYVAVPAVTVGADLAAAFRLSLGEGHVFDATMDAAAAYSPARDMAKSSAELSACSQNHIRDWTFVDLCASGGISDRDLGHSETTTASAGVTTLFALPKSAHEVTMTLSDSALTGGHQGGFSLGVTSVWDGMVTRLQAGMAAPVAGQTVQRARVAAGAAFVLANRPVDLQVWASRAEGGMTLGIARRDDAQGISMSTQWAWPKALSVPGPLSPTRVTTELGLSQTQSTISLYDDRQISLTARFALHH